MGSVSAASAVYLDAADAEWGEITGKGAVSRGHWPRNAEAAVTANTRDNLPADIVERI
jgi:hypothetical protein